MGPPRKILRREALAGIEFAPRCRIRDGDSVLEMTTGGSAGVQALRPWSRHELE